MPRSSRTPYAVLGALSQGPKSGYDISRLFERASMFFWNESYGQIYPTLKKLKEKGHVTMEREEREVGPDRKVYTITEDGQQQLERWLRQPASPHSMRDEYLLKLFFSQPRHPTVTLANLEKLAGELEETLESLAEDREELEERGEQGEVEAAEQAFHDLTLSWSERYHQTKLDWCKESIEVVKQIRNEREP